MTKEVADPAAEMERHRRPGGRAAKFVSAVHAATVALLGEQGYERVEIPAIAARAGVNKTSIYRRWPNKAELVLDAALARMRSDVPLPDTGSLEGDLTQLLRAIAGALASPFVDGLLRALITRDADAATGSARARFWDERYEISGAIVRRAIERGELPADVDGRSLMEMAAAPLFFRFLVTGGTVTDSDAATLAKRVTKAFIDA